MKKALNVWAVEPEISMEETFAAVKKAGFDGIELTMNKNPGPHSLSIGTTVQELEQVRELVKKYNLPVPSVCSGFWAV